MRTEGVVATIFGMMLPVAIFAVGEAQLVAGTTAFRKLGATVLLVVFALAVFVLVNVAILLGWFIPLTGWL